MSRVHERYRQMTDRWATAYSEREREFTKKVKEAYLYSTYYELHSSLGAQVWHVSTRDHTALPATHMFIHKWNEPYLPLTASRTAALNFSWFSFPVLLRVGG